MLNKLLPVGELFELYKRMGDTIITTIDLKSLMYDSEAVNNSLELMCEAGFIKFDEVSSTYTKLKEKSVSLDEFVVLLYNELLVLYPAFFEKIAINEIRYDETETEFYIKRNTIELGLSGLLMLIESMEKIKIVRSDVFILDRTLLLIDGDSEEGKKRRRSLLDLKKLLERNEEHGLHAELAALAYEKEMLCSIGVTQLPEIISDFDTSAGYDIVSYMDAESTVPDKFIEVKSCADNNWLFYLSRNEWDVAAKKKDNYFLYLYDRSDDRFKVIQNPYNILTRSSESIDWSITVQNYQVKYLKVV